MNRTLTLTRPARAMSLFISVMVASIWCGCVSAGQAAMIALQGSPTVDGPEKSSAAMPAGDASTSQSNRLMDILFGGSWLGDLLVILILLLSLMAIYLTVIHFITIRRDRFLPAGDLQEIQRLISAGETRRAEEYCRSAKPSIASQVIVAGLERFHNHHFGFAEYRSACEEAGESATGRLYRETEWLALIAAVAPMLGLSGTVLGMIEAFQTIGARTGIVQPQDLAGSIGEALITTLLGLFVAIPATVAVSFFRTRIDSLIAETGVRVERILMPIGRRPNPQTTKGTD